MFLIKKKLEIFFIPYFDSILMHALYFNSTFLACFIFCFLSQYLTFFLHVLCFDKFVISGFELNMSYNLVYTLFSLARNITKTTTIYTPTFWTLETKIFFLTVRKQRQLLNYLKPTRKKMSKTNTIRVNDDDDDRQVVFHTFCLSLVICRSFCIRYMFVCSWTFDDLFHKWKKNLCKMINRESHHHHHLIQVVNTAAEKLL